jgi:hypothetical protein
LRSSAAYLACADAYNKAAAGGTATTLKAAKALLKKAADAMGAFGKCVRGIAWTPAFQADVRAVLTTNSADQVTALVMASAKTWAVFDHYPALEQKQRLAASAAANQLRGDLGLPPPPVI